MDPTKPILGTIFDNNRPIRRLLKTETHISTAIGSSPNARQTSPKPKQWVHRHIIHPTEVKVPGTLFFIQLKDLKIAINPIRTDPLQDLKLKTEVGNLQTQRSKRQAQRFST
jgi:hypothetical protein